MRILLLFISLFIYSFINSSYAFVCSTNTADLAIDAKAIAVGQRGEVGTMIGRVVVGPRNIIINCGNQSGINSQNLLISSFGIGGTEYVYDNRIVYPTTVAGVGYAIGGYSYECNSGEVWARRSSGSSSVIVCESNRGALSTRVTLTPLIQFYNIPFSGNTGSGVNTETGTVIGFVSHKINGQTVPNTNGVTTAKVTLSFIAVRQTCKVSTQTVRVSMGKVGASSASSINQQIGEMKSFNIDLDCDANTKNAALLLEASSVQNSSLGVIGLNKISNSAQGVGVQILNDDGTPFPLNKAKSLKSPLSGSITVPLKARYFQTGNSITPGVANATATFTVVYQ